RPAAVGAHSRPAIGYQEVGEQNIAVERPGGGWLEPKRIETAPALAAQLLLHRFEEIPEGIPGLWRLRYFVARLLDQRVPNVKRRYGRHEREVVEAALFRDTIVVLRRQKDRRVELQSLGFYDLRQVLELAVPSIQRDGRPEGGTFNQIRYITSGYGRDDLLNHRPEWDDAVIYGVAARLLVLRHHVAERGVLLGNEALEPPYGCGLGGRVGDEWPSQGSSGGKSHRPTENRTPAKFTHAGPALICSLAGELRMLVGDPLVAPFGRCCPSAQIGA